MIETSFVILAFASMGVNVFQHVYWSRQTQKLIDKLMSRNYADYSYTKTQAESAPKSQGAIPLEIDMTPDPDLEQLNQQMSVGPI